MSITSIKQANGNGKQFLKINSTVIEIDETPTGSFQGYKISALTADDFDKLDSFDADIVGLGFIENNRNIFDAMWTFLS